MPIRRSDASGDTFIFTQFFDFSTQSWEDNIGYGTSWLARRYWRANGCRQRRHGEDGRGNTLLGRCGNTLLGRLCRSELPRRDRQGRTRHAVRSASRFRPLIRSPLAAARRHRPCRCADRLRFTLQIARCGRELSGSGPQSLDLHSRCGRPVFSR